ncbi:hypothetical protein DW036_06420 [Bacteroides sp. AF39-11AC]|nr:hypothetical protein DW036_06420 [Bacteroides sp. AF39-11AC]
MLFLINMRYSKQILLPQSYTLFLFSDKGAVFLLRESETRVTIWLHFCFYRMKIEIQSNAKKQKNDSCIAGNEDMVNSVEIYILR